MDPGAVLPALETSSVTVHRHPQPHSLLEGWLAAHPCHRMAAVSRKQCCATYVGDAELGAVVLALAGLNAACTPLLQSAVSGQACEDVVGGMRAQAVGRGLSLAAL